MGLTSLQFTVGSCVFRSLSLPVWNLQQLRRGGPRFTRGTCAMVSPIFNSASGGGPMRVIPVTAVHQGFGTTSRRDAWWAAPSAVFVGLSLFIVYATWAAFQGAHYTFGPYLSPFYSPEIFGDSPHAWFGPKPGAWPGWVPFSPALLILPFPGTFRLTCYYYRGAYYKSFWADPPSCAVGEPRSSYWGEASLPLILQNIHRWFLYAALVFLLILAHDVWKALWFADPSGDGVHFGIGVGTL